MKGPFWADFIGGHSRLFGAIVLVFFNPTMVLGVFLIIKKPAESINNANNIKINLSFVSMIYSELIIVLGINSIKYFLVM